MISLRHHLFVGTEKAWAPGACSTSVPSTSGASGLHFPGSSSDSLNFSCGDLLTIYSYFHIQNLGTSLGMDAFPSTDWAKHRSGEANNWTSTAGMAVWIHFPECPLEYVNDNLLMEAAKLVGKPLKIDTTTTMATKARFARICVEVDLWKPLVSKVSLGYHVLKVEYKGIYTVCFGCGIVGHRSEFCPSLIGNNGVLAILPLVRGLRWRHFPPVAILFPKQSEPWGWLLHY